MPPTILQSISHDLLPSISYIMASQHNVMCQLPTLLLDQLVLILLEFSLSSALESLAQHSSGFVSLQTGGLYQVTRGGSAPYRFSTGVLKTQCLAFCFLSTPVLLGPSTILFVCLD